MRKDFLWGGAVAAHQVEGGYNEKGKGLNVSDMMTVGGVGKKRKLQILFYLMSFILIMKRLIFIITIKKILPYLKNGI